MKCQGTRLPQFGALAAKNASEGPRHGPYFIRISTLGVFQGIPLAVWRSLRKCLGNICEMDFVPFPFVVW